jgi:chorismate mutase
MRHRIIEIDLIITQLQEERASMYRKMSREYRRSDGRVEKEYIDRLTNIIEGCSEKITRLSEERKAWVKAAEQEETKNALYVWLDS